MIIIIKTGGKIIKNGLPEEMVTDLKKNLQDNRIVLVHGGGAEVTEIAEKLGKKQEFIRSPRGFRSRYTDKETAELYSMVMAGKLNKKIVLKLQSKGVPSVGLSGIDGMMVQAERKKNLVIVDERGRRKLIDGDYTGRITKVDTKLLNLLIDNGYVPVISPIALGEEFCQLNVDGDRTAANIAHSIKADRLILFTDVEGVILDGKIVHNITLKEAKEQLSKIGPGMITKLYAAIEALENGVDKVIISSGFGEDPISLSLDFKRGTVVQVG